MCGIAGFYIRSEELLPKADDLLRNLLYSIDSRGGEATGYVAFSDDGVTEWQKAAVDAFQFMHERRRVPSGSHLVLCHTRLATQGLPGFMENNHPLKRGPFFLVHNGHVDNDVELFAKANRKAYGKVDSEAIVARLSSLATLDAVDTVMSEVEGSAAIAAVDERATDILALAKGQWSPIYVIDTKRITIFASTAEAVLRAHRACIGSINDNRAFSMSEGQVLWVTKAGITWSEFQVKKATYSKYTSKATGYSYHGSSDYRTGWESEDGWLERQGMRKVSEKDPAYESVEMDCDGCGESVNVAFMSFIADPEENVTWCLCKRCARSADAWIKPLTSGYQDEVEDEGEDDTFDYCADCIGECENGCFWDEHVQAEREDRQVAAACRLPEQDEDFYDGSYDACPSDPRFLEGMARGLANFVKGTIS